MLGHVQRGGSPTAYDRVLATRYGAGAIELIEEGRLGEMVCLQGNEIKSVSLDEAVGELKLVPVEGELMETARRVGIAFGD